MGRMFTLLVAACLVSLLTPHASGAVIKFEKTTSVDTAGSLWKPTNPTSYGNDVFCFNAEGSPCSTATCPESLLCSFDGGKTVTPTEASSPYCGSRGVMLDGQLLCANERLPSADNTTVKFSVVSFAPKGKRLVGPLAVEKQFHFTVSKSVTLAAETVFQFNGNSLYVPDEDTYLLALTAVSKDGVKMPLLFQSADGFSWAYVSQLPFVGPFKALYAVQLSGEKIAVISESSNGYERVTSSYMGKWWSHVAQLNSTAPPLSIVYPSGLTVEYGVANGTSLSAEYHVDHVPKHGRKRLSLDGKVQPPSTAGGKDDETSSSYAVVHQPSPGRILAVHDAVDAKGKKQLRLSAFSVDDSEEMKLLQEKREKEAKKKAEEEARREKLRKELLERQIRERREKRKRELERRRAFDAQDVENLALAKENMKADGEFVVVRAVQKSVLDLEKSTFFW